MKKWIVTICLMCLASFAWAEPNDVNVPSFPNGFTVSLMFADTASLGSEENVFVRGGYQYDMVEVFIGAEVQEFDFWELGFKLFGYNVVQQSSVPFLADFMALYFNPETMEIRGYTGLHWLNDELNKQDYTGAILGIEQKEKGSPVSLTAEAQYNNTERNKLVGFLGVKWGF